MVVHKVERKVKIPFGEPRAQLQNQMMMNRLMNFFFLGLLAFFSSCTDGNGPMDGEDDPTPYPLYSTHDYGTHDLNNLRLYLPEDHDENTEVVIMVHGGGWVMGYFPTDSVSTFTGRYNWNIVEPLLAEGYACAVMKYRTACYNTQADVFENKTTKYLDQMTEDIDMAIDYLKEESTEAGISNSAFHLLGESAGGHIVLSYGILADSDPDLKSVTSMFGPTNLDDYEFKAFVNSLPLIFAEAPNYFLKVSESCESTTNKQVRVLSSLKSFSDHQTIDINGENPFLDSISPAQAFNIQRNVPMFLTQGIIDDLVPADQATEMYQALQNAYSESPCGDEDFDCQHKLSIYNDCGHGWTQGGCDRAEIMSDIVDWIKAH